AGVGGSVTSPSGAVDPSALVVLFPVDASAWTDRGAFPRRLLSARTDRGGAYLISDVAPGQYFIVAVPEAQAIDWQAPAFLPALARSAPPGEVVTGAGATSP